MSGCRHTFCDINLPGQSKVSDMRALIGIQQNIGRFQIPMDDAMAMGILDSVRRLRDKLGGLSRSKRAFLASPAGRPRGVATLARRRGS